MPLAGDRVDRQSAPSAGVRNGAARCDDYPVVLGFTADLQGAGLGGGTVRNKRDVLRIPAFVVRGDRQPRLPRSPVAQGLAHHSFLGAQITVLCARIVLDEVGDHSRGIQRTWVHLPAPPSAVFDLPLCHQRRIVRSGMRIWRNVARTDLVFSQVLDHPVPLGWLAMPMAKTRAATRR